MEYFKLDLVGSWERQKAHSLFSTAAVNWFFYERILVVGGNNSFLYSKQKRKYSVKYKSTDPVHTQDSAALLH